MQMGRELAGVPVPTTSTGENSTTTAQQGDGKGPESSFLVLPPFQPLPFLAHSHGPPGLYTHRALAFTQHHALWSPCLCTPCPSHFRVPSFLVSCWGFLISKPRFRCCPSAILHRQNASLLLDTHQPCAHLCRTQLLSLRGVPFLGLWPSLH